MKLNRIELKKIIYDFNSISNRLLQVHFEEYESILNKFLSFVDKNQIIAEYVKDCYSEFDVKAEVEEVANTFNCIFSLGESDEEEVSRIYQILKYIIEEKVNFVYSGLISTYSDSTKYQDRVKGFNDRVVLVLIQHIEAYLTKIGIEMGMDEKVQYQITVQGGQVNLATDNSTINAVQNNGFDIQALENLINEVISKMPSGITKEDKEILEEGFSVIKDQVLQGVPKKTLLNMALKGMGAIKGGVEFTVALGALVQYVQSLY